MKLTFVDGLIIGLYLLTVVAIGILLRRRTRTAEDFFLSGRSIPAWVAGLAFMSANMGAQEVIGMAASGAKYGLATAHFYWVGAIPAMVFLGLFMMPLYYGSRARSVPEYLKLRFDEKTRGFNAVSFAVMTIVASGISMYAMGLLLNVLLGWPFDLSIWLWAGVVLFYIFMGGLTSGIYNEVLQFFLIVFGFTPVVILGLMDVGGWHGLVANLAQVSHQRGYAPDAYSTLWRHTANAADNPLGVGWFGITMGLGFVLSFGYWCTDFLLVQRAMATHSQLAARRTPLIASIPKILFPILVILPGMIAIALTQRAGGISFPLKPDGAVNYDLAMPLMLARYLPTGLLGLGITALMASFMSGMAGNVTAFNTTWTYEGSLSSLHGARRKRPALSACRPIGDGDRRIAFHRHRLFRRALQQHHGPAAAGLRFCERAPVRHFPARHVLEARHRSRRLHRASERDIGGGDPSRPYHCRSFGGGAQGWLARHHPCLAQRNGPGFLDRHHRLDGLFPGHGVREPGDHAAAGRGIARLGLFAHGQAGDGPMRWYQSPALLAPLVLGFTVILNLIFW